jgi:hypothetical protein
MDFLCPVETNPQTSQPVESRTAAGKETKQLGVRHNQFSVSKETRRADPHILGDQTALLKAQIAQNWYFQDRVG